MSRSAAAVVLAALIAEAGLAAPSSLLDSQTLWRSWPHARFVEPKAPCLRGDQLRDALARLAARHEGALTVEEIGRSAAGRPISLVRLGNGPRRALLWSQMHGDEPSATPALLDLADYLLSNRDDPEVRRVLASVTLLMIPMLNPDGAELYERRNSQGIDINRDALNLATPEGRLLKEARERFQPELGFNLHDQDRRTLAGAGGRLATISLLAVSGDPRGTATPGRARAKRVCSALAQVLAAFVPGGIARYDEDWSPRAFGDNLTAWGTPVVLIESGGPPPGLALEDLTRLNFVALLSALGEWARDDLAARDAAAYESLPRNVRDGYTDVVLRGGLLVRPGVEPYRADVAFDLLEGDRSRAGCDGARPSGSRIAEIGDARFLLAGRTVDAAGTLSSGGLVASVRGLGVRDWLTAEQLHLLASLGVLQVRWHVGAEHAAAAESWIAALPVPVRHAVRLVEPEAPASGLPLTSAVARPGGRSLAALLEAVAGAAGRARLAGRSLPQVLQELGAPPLAGERAGLAVGGPATFVVWEVDGPDLAASRASIRSVYIDGTEVPFRR